MFAHALESAHGL